MRPFQQPVRVAVALNGPITTACTAHTSPTFRRFLFHLPPAVPHEPKTLIPWATRPTPRPTPRQRYRWIAQFPRRR
jgi:hypothetical protein